MQIVNELKTFSHFTFVKAYPNFWAYILDTNYLN